MTGQALALADKLDSLVGCFAVGLIPSGSSDPFALRRAAMGIVKILVETKLPVSLSLIIARSARTFSNSPQKIAFHRKWKSRSGLHSRTRAILT